MTKVLLNVDGIMYGWNDIAEIFHRFEKKYFGEIQAIRIGDTLAWSAVKTPFYFSLIKPVEAESIRSSGIKRGFFHTLNRGIQKIIDACKLVYYLGNLFIKVKIRNKRLFFITCSVDRYAKNKDGYYVNYLTDGLIVNRLFTGHVYFEQLNNSNSSDGQPALIRKDFNLNLLYNFSFLFRKKVACNEEIKRCSDQLAGLLNRFFKEEDIRLSLREEDLEKHLVYFYTEYIICTNLFRYFTPAAIISSERPGTGMLAATKNYGIKFIDLQHGLINNYHPQYQYAEELKKYKKHMALPDVIGTFGKMHKDILLRNCFWEENEIAVLGSYRIFLYRNQHIEVTESSGEENIILVPTQWTVFNELKFLLEKLSAFGDRKYRVILKLHPLEKEESRVYYKEAGRKYSDWLAIEEGDVYNLIKRARVVMGFDSTVLLEAVSLSKPTITLGIQSMPDGIHDLIGSDTLKDALRLMPLDNITHLHSLLNKSIEDPAFYTEWELAVKRRSEELYATDYLGNTQKAVMTLLPVIKETF